MTLQTSGAIAMSQIAATFGGSEPYHLSSYYAGGAYVPSGTSGTNGAVPSSGIIKVSEFYGTSAFAGKTDTYTSGSGTETVPNGAKNVVIEVWGPGGTGGTSYTLNVPHEPGGGGGSGGYCRSSYSCSGGQTLNWTAGLGGSVESSTVTSGTLGITPMTGNPGGPGNNGAAGGPGSPGGGGGASGGNQANTNGNAGTGQLGGSAVVGNNSYSAGAGGNGAAGSGVSGSAGAVRFTYSA